MATVSRVYDLADLRSRAAAVLAPTSDAEPDVIDGPVDAVYPPVLMLVWGDPWIDVGPGGPVMGPCLWTAHLQILCIGSRVEPGPGIEQLESLVAHVIGRFKADAYTWPPATVGGPRQYAISGTDYLGARVNYDVPVTLGGP